MFKIISVLVLACGSAFAAFSFWPSSSVPATLTTGVRIQYSTSTTVGGSESVNQRTTRIQSVTGDWQEMTDYFNVDGSLHHSATIIAISGRGTFKLAPKAQNLLLIGSRPEGYRPTFDVAAAIRSPAFVGEATIAGHRAIGLKNGDTITYQAADLDGAYLKIESPGTTRVATGVELGSFSVDPLPDWPIVDTTVPQPR